MKLKSILLTGLSFVLVAAIAVGGTLAYLKNEDSDLNVMTLGNVEIAQHEYERVVDENGNYTTIDVDSTTSYELQAFTQEKPLYPIVGDPSLSGAGYAGWDDTTVRMSQVDSYGGMQVFAGKNAQDKFVTVENTGDSDAYVRTLVAVEIGEADEDLIGISYHNTWTKNQVGTIEIDNVNYVVFEFTYNGAQLSDGSWRHQGGILPAGDTTYPNLSQVYLKSVATNEDMEAIDGNDDGKLNILVLSQAVQAAGFDDAKTALNTAFGDVAANAENWFNKVIVNAIPKGDDDSVTYSIPEGTDYTVVSTTDELKAALNNKPDVIYLKNGEYNWSGTGHTGTSQTVSLYGESKNVVLYHTNEGEGNTDYDFDGYTVNFYGITISGEKNGASYPGWARMSATYNDCVIKQTYGLYAGNHEFNYCTLNVTGDQYSIWTWGAENATFNRCTFNSDGKAVLLYGTANTKLTVDRCVFNDKGGLTDLKAAIEIGNDYDKSYELIVNNTVVNGYEINDKGINTGTTLWGNKNSMGTDKLNVVIDGVDVY